MNDQYGRGAQELNIQDDQPEQCVLLHVLPQDGIGGVEIAARVAVEETKGKIRVHSLARSVFPQGALRQGMTTGSGRHPLSIQAAIIAVREAIRHRPQIILFSLWQTIFACLLIRAAFPRPKLVLFLHSDRDSHIIDFLATRLAACVADEIWADSEATLRRRLRGSFQGKHNRVISFVRKIETPPARSTFGSSFVSWCRLTRTKRLDRSIDLIGRLAAQMPQTKFQIIGPDHGEADRLQQLIEDMCLKDHVELCGPLDHASIGNLAPYNTFYLQLSEFEGQSMAVVEAMQLGLIPVVTPVGAIPEYCRDGVNAIIVHDIPSAVDKLVSVLASPTEMAKMSTAARTHFQSERGYSADLLEGTGG